MISGLKHMRILFGLCQAAVLLLLLSLAAAFAQENSAPPKDVSELTEQLSKVIAHELQILTLEGASSGQTPKRVIEAEVFLASTGVLLADNNDPRALKVLLAVLRHKKRLPDENDVLVRALVKIGKPAVGPLESLLADENKSARRRAALVLGRIADDSSLQPVIAAWERDALDAEDALAAFGPRAVPYLVAQVKCGGTRAPAAVEVLANIGKPAAPALIKALSFPAVDTRDLIKGDVARALGKLGEPSAIQPLEELFYHKEQSVREFCGKALDVLGWAPTNAADRALVLLARRSANDAPTVEEARAEASETLRAVAESLRASLAQLNGSQPSQDGSEGKGTGYHRSRSNRQQRDNIADCASMGHDATTPCVGLLKHPASEVRVKACEVLALLKDERAVPALVEALVNDERTRPAAGAALAAIGEPSSIPLRQLLDHPDFQVKAAAAKYLGNIDSKTSAQSVEALVAGLNDQDSHMRKDTLKALEEITGAGTEEEVFIQFVYPRVDAGKLSEAIGTAESYQVYVERNLTRVLAFASEQQRLFYMRCLRDLSHPYCMLVAAGSVEGMARSVLRLKGIVLDSLIEDSQVAAQSNNSEIKALVDQLRQAKKAGTQQQLFQQAKKGERDEGVDRVDQLESQLAEHFAGVGKTRQALRAKVHEVQAALTNDAALVEFVRYDHYLGKQKVESHYGVILLGNPKVGLQGAKAGEPVWVPLGSAEAIERNLKEYQQIVRSRTTEGLLVLRSLYTQVFEPVRQRLPEGIRTLVISPDAELNFVNFATLVSESGRFLAEDYALKYVTSGRDLVFGLKGRKPGRRLAAFANPAFGDRPALARAADTNAVQLAMASTDRRDYAGVSLLPLPNTAKEGEFLRDQSPAWKLEGMVYAGAGATEAEVKAVKSPYILHLATHGFFLPDTLPTNQPALRLQLPGQDRQPVTLHNPMHRSGLAFAGAQLTLDAWKRGETPDPENDGILMAQEAGTIDLKETWLVVLSACDTGVGEARGGEGVLGLRRGFIQAGAQNLLMTLWPVSDRWTMELMKAFYDRALKTGDAPMALAEVQREFLVKLWEQKGPVMAARLAGPFVMTFQGGQPQ